MDMLNQSCGLKIVVNPDDTTVRGAEDGPMHGLTPVKGYWEKRREPLLFDVMMSEIRKCVSILRSGGIRENVINPKNNSEKNYPA